MPELPEVETVVRELNRKLKGRTIASVEVRKPKIVAVGPKTVSNIRASSTAAAKKFSLMMAGHKFVSVKRRAKLLIFDLSGPLSMLAHLKMTGQFIFEDKALQKKTGSKYRILNKLTAPLVQLPSKYTHVIFRFKDDSTLYFNDLRQFGYLKIVKDDEVAAVPELQNYGPEPLEKSFTEQVFVKALERRERTTIKQALMDPTVVAGIGNIYSDEILYHARILPTRVVGTLDKKELRAIYRQIKPVLTTAIKYKGSSVGDFVRTDGKWGSMGKHHYVYGRKGQPCKRCGTIIKSVKLGGRTSCFCPKEQR
jgi:formamidopyrimidine-DNA glycosylase